MKQENDWDINFQPEREVRAQNFVSHLQEIKTKYPEVEVLSHDLLHRIDFIESVAADILKNPGGFGDITKAIEEQSAHTSTIRVNITSTILDQVEKAKFDTTELAKKCGANSAGYHELHDPKIDEPDLPFKLPTTKYDDKYTQTIDFHFEARSEED